MTKKTRNSDPLKNSESENNTLFLICQPKPLKSPPHDDIGRSWDENEISLCFVNLFERIRSCGFGIEGKRDFNDRLQNSINFDTILMKREKLLQKAIVQPHKIRFHELETLLKQYGYKRIKTNAGSHFKWFNAEKDLPFRCPYQNPIKPIYVKELTHQIREYH